MPGAAACSARASYSRGPSGSSREGQSPGRRADGVLASSRRAARARPLCQRLAFPPPSSALPPHPITPASRRPNARSLLRNRVQHEDAAPACLTQRQRPSSTPPGSLRRRVSRACARPLLLSRVAGVPPRPPPSPTRPHRPSPTLSALRLANPTPRVTCSLAQPARRLGRELRWPPSRRSSGGPAGALSLTARCTLQRRGARRPLPSRHIPSPPPHTQMLSTSRSSPHRHHGARASSPPRVPSCPSCTARLLLATRAPLATDPPAAGRI